MIAPRRTRCISLRTARLRTALATLAGAAAVALASSAAGAASPEDEARADVLFDQGRASMMEGQLDVACATLEESLRLHDRGDTLLNLAECHRRQGRTASAWSEFERAIEHADRVKYEDAMTVARARRDELVAVLSTVTVTVPDAVAALDDLAIELDGAPLPADQWNRPMVRDPGTYVVAARAKGHLPLSRTVRLGSPSDAQVIVVALDPVPPPPAPPAPPPAPPAGAEIPAWPFVVGGAGLVLVGVSAAFAVDAMNAGSDLDAACGEGRATCPPGDRQDLEATRSREVTSFGAFVGLGVGGILALGVAGVGLGVALSDEPTATTTNITVGPGSVGLRRSFH